MLEIDDRGYVVYIKRVIENYHSYELAISNSDITCYTGNGVFFKFRTVDSVQYTDSTSDNDLELKYLDIKFGDAVMSPKIETVEEANRIIEIIQRFMQVKVEEPKIYKESEDGI